MKKILLSAVFFSLFCANPFHLQGATKTWAGTPTSCVITDVTNWTGGLPTFTDIASFNKTDTCSGPNTIGGGIIAQELLFGGASGTGYEFTFNNASLEVDTAGISPLSLPYSVTFDVTTSSFFTFHGGSLSKAVFNMDASTIVLSATSAVSGDSATINLTDSATLQLLSGSATVGNLTSDSPSDHISRGTAALPGTNNVGSTVLLAGGGLNVNGSLTSTSTLPKPL